VSQQKDILGSMTVIGYRLDHLYSSPFSAHAPEISLAAANENSFLTTSILGSLCPLTVFINTIILNTYMNFCHFYEKFRIARPSLG
jgi:hypothetical protein